MKKNKNKRMLVIITCLLIIIECTTVFLMYKSLSNKKPTLDEVKILNNSSSSGIFAIMLENQSGEYVQSQTNSWPTSGYTFNSERSGCMDSSGEKIHNALEFSNGVARIKTNKKVSCYMYFDVEIPAFAIYSADDNSLTFIKSKTVPVIGGVYNNKSITQVFSNFESKEYDSYISTIPWSNLASQIKSVVIQDEISPIYMDYWFYKLSNCTHFDLSKLNTTKVISMEGMFTYVNDVPDISGWDLSKVKDMSYMFQSVSNIPDISDWDVSNVTKMTQMFADTSNIPDISGWNVSNVTNMQGMFATASNIPDISGWDVSNVTNMSIMFFMSSNIPDISGWDVSNVTKMTQMFENASTGFSAATPLDLSGWDVSKVSDNANFMKGISPAGSIISPNFAS